MFAVPGWSVSAGSLKTETATSQNNSGPTHSKSRKRKRTAAAPENVTAANVADLWESVIGIKDKEPKAEKKKRRRKQEVGNGEIDAAQVTQPKATDDKPGKEREGDGSGKKNAGSTQSKKPRKASQSEETGTKAAVSTQAHKSGKAAQSIVAGGEQTKPKKQKEKSKDKSKHEKKDHSKASEPKPDIVKSTAEATQGTSVAVVQAPPQKLTPLQASMREKLVSARFRHLNETLYTRPSAEAYRLFDDSPEMFSEYHEGFRRQVDVWPENPVDGYIADIQLRAKVRYPSRGKNPNAPAPTGPSPLPRTNGLCTIADLGCGDARLASILQPKAQKLKLGIHSYDLHSPSPLVTKADIANLPLADGSVDIAIFCLALMGTNWLDFVEEAYRILHWKGELWVAEIKSRFGHVSNRHAPVNHSVGNRRKPAATKKPKQNPEATDAERQDLAVEVDGADDKRHETDVSGFVEALRKRGFVPLGEGQRSTAVDLSNKMFVRMQFVKAASPTKGKGAVKAKDSGGAKKKFLDTAGDDGDELVNEAAILKPCVYKIR